MDNQFRFLIYKTETEDVSVDALIRDDTIWLTQKAMAELFAIDKSGISRHLKNIFESGELDEEVVVAKIAIPTKHGAIPEKEQLSPTNYYNLDAIISVGYRVDSIRATNFRKWATAVLKEYMVKGFAMDDDRLKPSAASTMTKLLLPQKNFTPWCRTSSIMPSRDRPVLKLCTAVPTTPRTTWGSAHGRMLRTAES